MNPPDPGAWAEAVIKISKEVGWPLLLVGAATWLVAKFLDAWGRKPPKP